MLKFAITLIIVTFLYACKKNESHVCNDVVIENHSYEKILPSDYLMAYPGSWWEYSNGEIDTASGWDSVYLYDNSPLENGCKLILEDVKILPRINKTYIANEDLVYTYEDKAVHFGLSKLISEEEGVFEVSKSGGGKGKETYSSTITRTSEGILDSYTVNGVTYNNVLKIKEVKSEYYNFVGGGPPPKIYEKWYVKGIGKIAETRKLFNIPVLDSLHLVNHFIAPH